MARLKLFKVAVLLHPTEKEEKEGGKTEILVEPKTVLETNEKTAAMKASFEIPEKFRDKLDQIEILAGPF